MAKPNAVRPVSEVYDPESPIATPLRRLYHNMQGAQNQGRKKSFLVTSSNRGEGKTTITSYLAMTIAQFPRQKVLVVDADLRRSRVHKVFGLKNEVGLRECLEDGEDPMKVLQSTPAENLDVICGGKRSESPARLFEAERLVEFFEKVHFYYDVILVDSPPVIPVSDTLFLCPQVESVLLVVMAGVTPKDMVGRAKQILDDSGANMMGVILNNALEVLPAYYDYSYYGYADK